MQPDELVAREPGVGQDRWLPLVEVIKINPSSLVELKTTLDDTVREVTLTAFHISLLSFPRPKG
jgi:hypothetical protein